MEIVTCSFQSELPQPGSCKDIQEHDISSSDGEHTLIVSNKEVTIYCHNMASSNPQVGF